jgi:hypothetical protein
MPIAIQDPRKVDIVNEEGNEKVDIVNEEGTEKVDIVNEEENEKVDIVNVQGTMVMPPVLSVVIHGISMVSVPRAVVVVGVGESVDTEGRKETIRDPSRMRLTATPRGERGGNSSRAPRLLARLSNV